MKTVIVEVGGSRWRATLTGREDVNGLREVELARESRSELRALGVAWFRAASATFANAGAARRLGGDVRAALEAVLADEIARGEDGTEVAEQIMSIHEEDVGLDEIMAARRASAVGELEGQPARTTVPRGSRRPARE